MIHNTFLILPNAANTRSILAQITGNGSQWPSILFIMACFVSKLIESLFLTLFFALLLFFFFPAMLKIVVTMYLLQKMG